MALRISAASKALIKASIPAVAAHGPNLTKSFYNRMFKANPELLNTFNLTHQRNGTQPKALFGSIVYAAQSALSDGEVQFPAAALACICHKHCSLDIAPEAYDIVGANLLGTIKEDLNAAQDVLDAWAELYGTVAGAMIATEKALYEKSVAVGGWRGKKPFRIAEKLPVSERMTLFRFAPLDGSVLPEFNPGQYVSLWASKEQLGIKFDQPRQYSLISDHKAGYFDVAVNLETGGLVSTWLHEKATVGTEVKLTAPFGPITLPPGKRVVFFSAGSGITGNLALMRNILWSTPSDREVVWVYGAKNGANHAFRAELMDLAKTFPNFKRLVFYSEPRPEDVKGMHYHEVGLVDVTSKVFQELVPHPTDGETDFLLSGGGIALTPIHTGLKALGVAPERVHVELFGSGLNLAAP